MACVARANGLSALAGLRKIKTGNTEPVYEKYILKALGIERLKS